MLAPPSSGAVRRATWCWGSQQQPAPTSVSGPSPPPPVRLPVATPAPPSTASSPPWSSCTRWGRGWGSSATPATSPRPWTSWSVGSRETGQLASPHVRTSSSNSSSSSYSTSLSRTYLISDSYQNITTAQCYISLINQQGRFVGRSREHFLYCLLIFVWNVNKSSLVIIVFFVLVVTGLGISDQNLGNTEASYSRRARKLWIDLLFLLLQRNVTLHTTIHKNTLSGVFSSVPPLLNIILYRILADSQLYIKDFLCQNLN